MQEAEARVVFGVFRCEKWEERTLQGLFNTMELATEYCATYAQNNPRKNGWIKLSGEWKAGNTSLNIEELEVKNKL
jgi:hypothetical protein